LTGEDGGGPPLHQRLEQIIKKYGIGIGKKARKSKFPKKSTKFTNISRKKPNPSFIAHIRLKIDQNTGNPKDHGEVTIPSQFRNVILPQHFPGAQPRDYYQIKITNLRIGKAGPVTCQVKTRGRIQFKQNLFKYFNYKPGDQIRFEFQKHFPQSQIGKISSAKTISSFKLPKDSYMMRIYLPKDFQQLTGLDKYQPKRYVHMGSLGHQVVGKQYPDGSIGVKPASLGLPFNPQTSYSPVTIHNPHLTPDQKNQLVDQSRAEFVARELKQFQDDTGIQFTGDPTQDKPQMLEHILNDLTTDGLFDDFVSVKFNPTIPNTLYKPDGIGRRRGMKRPEIIELKAFAINTNPKLRRFEDQFTKYNSLGYRVNVVTTRKNLPKKIEKLVNKVYTVKDVSKWVNASGKPLLRQLLDKICENWP
jgi:hypothetical protein